MTMPDRLRHFYAFAVLFAAAALMAIGSGFIARDSAVDNAREARQRSCVTTVHSRAAFRHYLAVSIRDDTNRRDLLAAFPTLHCDSEGVPVT